ncbi:MIP/aquaporin family protein [Oleiharenicola lentus]|uniref:MIP/aquaporin family protein n=1 Tax=Oleiharenicola lentus TaxID=2508720 RepID=UPI003F67ED71
MRQGKRVFLPAWLVGEFLGTFILVFFGCGGVASAVLTGAQVGVFQVAVVWGIAIALAIHIAGGLSGAHLNPAITVALATWTDFRWKLVPRYVAAQFLGAFAASAALYAAFHGALRSYEAANDITRGAVGSEASAMIFGEFFPNPAGQALTEAARAAVTLETAFFIEAIGAGILALAVMSITDLRNKTRAGILAPAMIGLTVTILISVFGALTMAAFNPARDLAPRIFSAFAGWESVPFATNETGWFWVYVVAPLVGAVLGGGAYRWLLAPHYSAASGEAS